MNLNYDESFFNQKAKSQRRNWKPINEIATFNLKDSNYTGQVKALSKMKEYPSFEEYFLKDEKYYSIQFNLRHEFDFRKIIDSTASVRKFTEIEILGNYFNPTDLVLAFWLNSSHTQNDYEEKLKIAQKTNTQSRIDNSLKIIDFLNSIESVNSENKIFNTINPKKSPTMKSKSTAGILAILVGGIGIHKFYLGKTGMGILYIVFCWTLIPAIVGLIEGIIYLTMSDESFNIKYNFKETILNQTRTSKSEELEFLKKKKALLLEEGLIILKRDLDSGQISAEMYDVRKRQLELEASKLS